MQQMKSLCLSLLASLVLAVGITFVNPVAAQQGMPELSLKELQEIPLKKLINPKEQGEVFSCNIGFDDENKKIVEYKITDGKEPEKLRAQLTKLKPGEMIYIDARLAMVDGKRLKLPSLVYKITE